MMARHRGDLCVHTRWRPILSTAAPPRPPAAHSEEVRRGSEVTERPRARRQRSRALVAAATVIAIVLIAAQQQAGPAPTAPRLPSSAQQWVDQWTAASLQNPARVCGQLFAPALVRALQADKGHSCSRDYISARRDSFRIRHLLEHGGTAAVEAQQVDFGRRSGYFTIVLSHLHGGWRAVDVVRAGSAGPR
jgi:hypothetical protein